MKKVLLIACLVSLVSTAAAQTSNAGASGASECKLKLAQAPVIRGIHLGMTVNEVLAVFPGSEKNVDLRQRLSQPRLGLSFANVNPSNYASKEKFVGVRNVHFGFLDGELNSFTVWYDGPEWKTIDQFASKVAEAFNLPGGEFWEAGSSLKTLTCDGFAIRVHWMPDSGSNTIFVRNLQKDANKIVRERDEALKDEARRAFKP